MGATPRRQNEAWREVPGGGEYLVKGLYWYCQCVLQLQCAGAVGVGCLCLNGILIFWRLSVLRHSSDARRPQTVTLKRGGAIARA